MKIYLVGGAVRDLLLGVESQDKDYVVTGSCEEEMISLGFEKVGADFPVFLHPETKEEYALARKEKKTGPGYHGFEVQFDPNVTIEEDLSRRDLTINAMAMDIETGQIIDPYNGQVDLSHCILRHVSDAFSEDPVRVLRLARFLVRYGDRGFSIANETIDMAKQVCTSEDFLNIKKERVWKEIEKVMQTSQGWTFFSVMSHLNTENRGYVGQIQQAYNNSKYSNLLKSIGLIDWRMRLGICLHDKFFQGNDPSIDSVMKEINHFWYSLVDFMSNRPRTEDYVSFILQHRLMQETEIARMKFSCVAILSNGNNNIFQISSCMKSATIIPPSSMDEKMNIKAFVTRQYMDQLERENF